MEVAGTPLVVAYDGFTSAEPIATKIENFMECINVDCFGTTDSMPEAEGGNFVENIAHLFKLADSADSNSLDLIYKSLKRSSGAVKYLVVELRCQNHQVSVF